jgi:hypothetical protein
VIAGQRLFRPDAAISPFVQSTSQRVLAWASYLGATGTTIVGTFVIGNVPGGDTVATGGVVAIAVLDGTALTDNRVSGNVVLGNHPDPLWDQQGPGMCSARTSTAQAIRHDSAAEPRARAQWL